MADVWYKERQRKRAILRQLQDSPVHHRALRRREMLKCKRVERKKQENLLEICLGRDSAPMAPENYPEPFSIVIRNPPSLQTLLTTPGNTPVSQRTRKQCSNRLKALQFKETCPYLAGKGKWLFPRLISSNLFVFVA